jgi:ABC-2 type transport system ATP-binding protein
MNTVELHEVTKRYERYTGSYRKALDAVSTVVPEHSIVGLIGRNGSGKSTLLRHVTGLVLPDEGRCMTLGSPSSRLGRSELARIGVVDQDSSLVEWMRGSQLLRYVSTFYDTWDRDLERELVQLLDVDVEARVGGQSPGNVQRLALVLALCHRPELLLLDEPLSDLDPISRQTVLGLLLDRFTSDNITIVISSHMLRDIEPVVNRVLCLHEGRVVADDDADVLRERHAEWRVTSSAGRLPDTYAEDWIVSAQGDSRSARLLVRDAAGREPAFAAQYAASVDVRPLSLEQVFPLLLGSSPRGALPVALTAPEVAS